MTAEQRSTAFFAAVHAIVAVFWLALAITARSATAAIIAAVLVNVALACRALAGGSK